MIEGEPRENRGRRGIKIGGEKKVCREERWKEKEKKGKERKWMFAR